MEYLLIAFYIFGGSYVASYQLEKNKSISESVVCFFLWPFLGLVATVLLLAMAFGWKGVKK